MLLTMETPAASSQARPAANFARPAPAPSPFEPSPPAQPAHYGGGGGGGVSGGGMGMGSGSGAPASTGSHGSGSGGYILPEDFLRVRQPRPALVARLTQLRARATQSHTPTPPQRTRQVPGSGGRSSASAPAGASSGAGLSQMEQDEMMAQMLQDELFMSELQSRPEFGGFFGGAGLGGPGLGGPGGLAGPNSRYSTPVAPPPNQSKWQRCPVGSACAIRSSRTLAACLCVCAVPVRGRQQRSRMSGGSGSSGGGSSGPTAQQRMSAMGSDMKTKMMSYYQRFRGSGSARQSNPRDDGSHQRLVDHTSSDDDEEEVIAWDSEGASGTQQRRHVLDRSSDRDMEMQELGSGGAAQSGRSKSD